MKDTFKKEMKFSSDEISVFCDQIAMLLNGGITLYEGAYILYNEMEDKKIKIILKQIVDKINVSAPFYQSLEETHAFPDYMIHMVKIGETTGKLEEVMRSLSIYYERESNVKASIRSAIAYPVVLFAVMAVILLVLVYKILPFFENMFQELNTEVAASTENMMTFGVAAGRTMAIFVSILLILVLVSMVWYRTNNGERILKFIFEKFRLTTKLTQMMATGKFISSMALMISSGIENEEALVLASGTSDNKVVRNRILICKELIHKNMSLEKALRESELIVGMEARMISVAAKSGAIDTVFAKLGEQYNRKITGVLGKIANYVETSLVVVLTVMIGTVLISVMLPLVSMLSSIG